MQLSGGSEDDMLNGSAYADVLEGDRGNDTIEGYDGTDTIRGGDGSDTISLGKGISAHAWGGAGDDSMDSLVRVRRGCCGRRPDVIGRQSRSGPGPVVPA